MIRLSGSLPGYRPLICVLLVAATLVPVTGLLAQPGPEQKITASDPDNFDSFGASVDIFGRVAVVGAPGDDQAGTNAGAAYVFRYVDGSWTEEQKLMPSSVMNDQNAFGFDVTVERNLIAVGAPGDHDAAAFAGAVYLFEWNGTLWEETQKFLPTSASPSADAFGTAIDLGISVPDQGANPPEQTNLAVGAPKGSLGTRGAVYNYVRQTDTIWELLGGGGFEPELAGVSAEPCANDGGELGASIAIRGNVLLAGAPSDDQHAQNAGTGCSFSRVNIINNWSPFSIAPTTPAAGDVWGSSVAVDKVFGQYIAVFGAPNAGATSDGRIVILDGGQHSLTVAGSDDFGKGVAIEGLQVVVGAPRDDTVAQDAGAIYFFNRDEVGTWNPAGMLLASDVAGEKQFGAAVAYRHSSLIVGSPEAGAIPGPGAAYVYTSGIFADGFESGDTTAW
jgi:hypothetical protein